MHFLSVKEICVAFITKRLKLSFANCNIVICHPQQLPAPSFPFGNFLRYLDIKKGKLRRERACEKKNILVTKKPIQEKMIIILKGFIKQPVIRQSATLPSFSILIDCCVSDFSLSL